MVRRVCRELGNKRNIVVLNDEAHHCYRSQARRSEEKLTGDDRKEAEEREEEARLWITGLEAVQAKIGVKAVYDLSATPFFLRGSGYPEGTLFPWVVSDFSLIDAIESGIVKIPRVPVADDAMTGEQPTYRDLWPRIRDGLPRKGRGTEAVAGAAATAARARRRAREPLRATTRSTIAMGARTPRAGPTAGRRRCSSSSATTPTSASSSSTTSPATKQTRRTRTAQPIVAPGKLPIFSNVEGNRWLHRPNTILVDSEQLESGEGMSPSSRSWPPRRSRSSRPSTAPRFPGRDAESLTDEDLMREVMNTVGKAGQARREHPVRRLRVDAHRGLGRQHRDAHPRRPGVRDAAAVRAGRRPRTAADELHPQRAGPFRPGICRGLRRAVLVHPLRRTSDGKEKKPATPKPGRVKAMPERLIDRPWLEITFPRVAGYRYELPPAQLEATFADESRVVLSTQDIPTSTENAPIVGETAILTLDDLKTAARAGSRVHHCEADPGTLLPGRDRRGRDGRAAPAGGVQVWLFPQVLAIVRRWLAECVVCYDDTFPQLLLFTQKASEAAEKIYRAIVASAGGEKRLRAEMQRYDQPAPRPGLPTTRRKTTWHDRRREVPHQPRALRQQLGSEVRRSAGVDAAK